MDLNSPEFYTIAFVVAMALVALLMGHREKGPASTHRCGCVIWVAARCSSAVRA